MKKIFSFLFCVALIVCFSGCDDVSLLYSDSGEKDGFYIAINEVANCCFVGEYTCTEYVENKEITIPDEYKNKPITRMGGYFGTGYPTPFSISVADLYMNAPANSEYWAVYCGDIEKLDIPRNYRVEELTFTLNIGKNIDTIANVDMGGYYPHINEDESVTYYHPVVYVNCSEDNKYFYSENGKLYDKKTKELISAFEYSKPNGLE